jgi:LPXTG-motif cell wall-anchored protein
VSVIIHFTTETAQENTTNESETETGNNNNSTGLPQTGVISNIVLFASLLLISIAGAIFTLILMKRNKEQSRG